MRKDSHRAGRAEPSGAAGVSAAWRPFQGRLAEVLGALEEDQYLVISSKRGSAYVQFAAQGSFGLRAEAVSNNYLPKGRRLGKAQVEALQELGWLPPTGTPSKATPKSQPDGSPNFFRDFGRPVPVEDVARLAVRTLREVHGIGHPGSLDYLAFERGEETILLPTLGLKRRRPAPSPKLPPAASPERIRPQLLEALRAASGDPDLDFDEDGDLPLRFGSAIVFVRVLDDPPCIRVFSPVLSGIEEGALPLERLNELNATLRYLRFFAFEDAILASVDLPAAPFVADHAVDACERLGHLVDELDEDLQEQFGGRTAFGGDRPETPLQ